MPVRTPSGLCLLAAALVLGFAGPSAAQGVTDLGTLPTHSGSRARDITDQGTIVGQAWSNAGLPQQAVRWARQGSAGFTVEELPTLSGLVDSDAMGVSNSGAAVGWSALFDDAFSVFRAVLWKHGASQQWGPVDLGVPDGYETSVATDINGRGDVVGTAPLPPQGSSGGLLWSRGTRSSRRVAPPRPARPRRRR